MLTQTVTYIDPFTEKAVTETVHFHMTVAEVVEMEMRSETSISDTLQSIIDSGSNDERTTAFKKFIMQTYGVRTEGGKFRKSAQISEEFASSEAYSEFLLGLLSDADAAARFVRAVMPKNLQEKAEQLAKAREDNDAKSARQLSEESMQGHKQSASNQDLFQARQQAQQEAPEAQAEQDQREQQLARLQAAETTNPELALRQEYQEEQARQRAAEQEALRQQQEAQQIAEPVDPDFLEWKRKKDAGEL